MRVACFFVPASLLALALAAPGIAHAAPVWVGDFETGDLSQWSYLLNSDVDGMTYSQADTQIVTQGTYAGRIELHNDAVWGNGLKRVELQHAPAPGRTAEGQTTYFAWSFYLPEALPAEPGQQIGYWESNGSYQQMMAFDVAGERMQTARTDDLIFSVPEIIEYLSAICTLVPGDIIVNGSGTFATGGPEGDNGLSGKETRTRTAPLSAVSAVSC